MSEDNSPKQTPNGEGTETKRGNKFSLLLEQLTKRLEDFASMSLKKLPKFLERVEEWAKDAAVRLKEFFIPNLKLLWKDIKALSIIALWYLPGLFFLILSWAFGSVLLALLGVFCLVAVTWILFSWEPEDKD